MDNARWFQYHVCMRYKDVQLVKVRRCALPIRMTAVVDGAVSSTAVLGLHGYGGYSGELALPARLLHQAGCSVYVPRLPGHGTTQQDFDRTTRHDWMSAAVESYLDLSAAYEHVYVMGHSMGGLLAVLLAAVFPVERLALMAPALEMRSRYMSLAPVLRLLRHSIPIDWEPDPSVEFFDDRDPDDDTVLGKEYWSSLNLKQINELFKLRKEATRLLPKVSADTLVLTGGNDPTVPEHVGAMIEAKIKGPVRHVHLPESSHLIPYDPNAAERTVAMDEILRLFVEGWS